MSRRARGLSVAVAVPLALALLTSTSAAQRGQPETIRIGSVTAVSWPDQRRLAGQLALSASRPADYPGLPSSLPPPLRLIVAPDGDVMDSLTAGSAPSWGAGIALPDERIVLLRADDPEIERTLRHELAHLALHRAVTVRVPLWFDEGYAATAAREWERFGGLALNLSVARGSIPDLDALDGALRGTATTADAAYALATVAVGDLAALNPTASLQPLLTRLRAGESFEGAVLATTGLTAGQFEAHWQASVRRKYGLVVWLSAGGGWVIVTLIVWALLRRRRRFDRPRRAALDEGWSVPDDDAEPEASGATQLDPTPRP